MLGKDYSLKGLLKECPAHLKLNEELRKSQDLGLDKDLRWECIQKLFV